MKQYQRRCQSIGSLAAIIEWTNGKLYATARAVTRDPQTNNLDSALTRVVFIRRPVIFPIRKFGGPATCEVKSVVGPRNTGCPRVVEHSKVI